jgi:[acyl-carrier-protein] S-malonyltransferase
VSDLVAFVFPGQGSQTVGMGLDVYRASPAARAIYDLGDRALGFALSTLCFEGPGERLRETINTQPAIVVTSLALLAAMQEAASRGEPADDGGISATPLARPGRDPVAIPLDVPLRPDFTAGHSVGEYTALAAAGALGVAETLRLVRERGRLMHEEGQRCPSGMAAVLGLNADALEPLCTQATEETLAALGIREEDPMPAEAASAHPGEGRVVIANDNAPGQIVLSGSMAALERATELARAAGARRVVPLAVSGAFHSPVMAPAALALAEAVNAAPLCDARVPIVSNMMAQPITEAGVLRLELAHQIASPVQWTKSVEYLVGAGVRCFIEIGPGQVLAGLIRRISREVEMLSISSAADLNPVAQQVLALTRRG